MTIQKESNLLIRIGGEKKLEKLLADFYKCAHLDKEIGSIFEKNVQDWGYHIRKVVVYWSNQTRAKANLKQSFPQKHRPLNLNKNHFIVWLNLFKEACERNLEKKEANEIYSIAHCVAMNLYRKVVEDKEPDF